MRLEALRGSERRMVRIVGMVGLTLDETPTFQPFFDDFQPFLIRKRLIV